MSYVYRNGVDMIDFSFYFRNGVDMIDFSFYKSFMIFWWSFLYAIGVRALKTSLHHM